MDPSSETLSRPKPSIEVIYAGGTISSLVTPQGYREGGHVVDLVGQLEQHKPGFKDSVTLGEAAVAYTGLSENIDEHYWEDISQKVTEALVRNPDSVVITHGTDSMEQTAKTLQKRFAEQLRAKNAKIILTGANDETDALDNLEFAFDCSSGQLKPGVYIAFHKRLIPADLVVKEPFNGASMNYASRNNLEYQRSIHEQEQRSKQQISQLETYYGRGQGAPGIVDYPVNIVRSDHKGLLDEINAYSVRAVLLTLYHSGTANTEKPNTSVAELAKKLREKGITLFAVTENSEPVNFGGYETSVLLQEAGIVPLGNMLHSVALAKLRLIDPKAGTEQLKQEMLTNHVGELAA